LWTRRRRLTCPAGGTSMTIRSATQRRAPRQAPAGAATAATERRGGAGRPTRRTATISTQPAWAAAGRATAAPAEVAAAG